MLKSGAGRHSFAGLTFGGRHDSGAGPPPMRTNAFGIGTHFAARIDSMWVAGNTLRNSSGPGQSLQPVVVGLSGHPQIDFVSIDWSDGVFQTEIDLKSGELHTIVEEQRQISSCPVLFTWDGDKYTFVTDLLGVGGIGYMVAPGEYAPSRPWERLLLPSELLQPRNGHYILKLSEPMEEACYLDAARLVAYDLPPEWKMTLDERMSIMGPAPTGEARFYRHKIVPSKAINDRGENVIDDVLSYDLNAAPVGELDHRFIGRLKGDHVLTLMFDAPIDVYQADSALSRERLLVIDGWVEYPYSQTMFAAWQAKAEYRAPTIEARGDDGRWRTVLEQFGYPAGMPRPMSVPLDNLPPGTTHLRITTNQEIYFDRIAVAFTEPCPQAVRRELRLAGARLIQSGFPQRTTGPQRQPSYDYDQRTPFWDARYQRGFYTRVGPVDELVAARDDAMAIFGPGEEVHMEFAADLGPLPEGWSRVLVFEADGWCKDMDLFTKDGETLEPLPGSGSASSQRDALHRQYNTRFESGR